MCASSGVVCCNRSTTVPEASRISSRLRALALEVLRRYGREGGGKSCERQEEPRAVDAAQGGYGFAERVSTAGEGVR